MQIPTRIIFDPRKGGVIEGDKRGGVWWLDGVAVDAWGNMAHMLGQKLKR